MTDGLRELPAETFNQAQQGLDPAVIGRQRSSLLDVFVSRIELLLARRQEAEIGPTGRLAGSESSGEMQLFLGPGVVAALQCGEPDIERAHEIVILGGPGRG